jgi:putative SOS response-associated peptidase YedK
MCGRFVLLTDLSVILERFAVGETSLSALPAGDLVPGQFVPAVIHDGGNRLVSLRWGLIPSWARDPAIGKKMINARSETLAEKPSFINAFSNRRCLVVADGFYEWAGEKGHKRRFLFRLRSGEAFGFAGLFESWKTAAGEAVHTCTIITTVPNDLVAPIHDRMPVILPRGAEAHWLDPSLRDHAPLRLLLKPYPADEMAAKEFDQPPW